MDFFEQQEQARAASKRLVWMYAMAVAGVVLSIHAVVSLILLLLEEDTGESFLSAFLNPGLFLWTAAGTGLVILAGTLLKIGALRGGGAKVAESMGAREVAPNTRDFSERRLLNVVEEMALAAGVRVPRVYVLDNEGGMNAFAAGYTPDDAAIAVTSGLLRKLNREELQAVIGHEFSHILNGDMRLNIRLIGILGGILGISVVGQVVLELAARSIRVSSGRRSSRKNNGVGGALALLLLGASLWIIGWIGVFFGRMIQSAVSRHREFLADSSAAQFTRNPEGLASALKLIGANPAHGGLNNGHASEVSHMLFASGGSSLFATHPPLLQRIRKLDPAFNGDFGPVREQLKRRAEELQQHSANDDPEDASLLALAAAARLAVREEAHRDPPSARFRNGSTPTALAWMPPDERSALREPDSAECCLYASVLSEEPSVRQRQREIIRDRDELGEAFETAAEGWSERHADWTPRQRRMACELAVEALRASDPGVREAIARRLDRLSLADGHRDSFEFALARLLRRRLLDPPESASSRGRTQSPVSLNEEAVQALSGLARFGSRTQEEAGSAWAAGVRRLSLFGPMPSSPVMDVSLKRFEDALERLAHLPPLAKREFMNACEALVLEDGELSGTQENYLVAIADAIDAVGWTLSASDLAPSPAPRPGPVPSPSPV